jgi:magnesium transporter
VTEVLHGLDAAGRERVAALRAEGRFFWLDASLTETGPDDLVAALDPPEHALRALRATGDAGLSRTLRSDGASLGFALRCYVEDTPPSDDDEAVRRRPVLVHVVLTGDYLLTLHEEQVSLPAALAADLAPERGRGYAVYSVLDAIIASTFDALEEVELTLDALGATWTDGNDALAPRATLRETGARLATMRRWVTREQAVLGRLGVEMRALRGFDVDEEPRFDRLDEQVDRLLASIDAAANALGMVLDLQLNERAYLLSVVAAIFGPLTLITGFFGMNFGWMVDRIETPAAFWLLGLLVPLTTATLGWRLVVRRFLPREAPNPRTRGLRRARRAAVDRAGPSRAAGER